MHINEGKGKLPLFSTKDDAALPEIRPNLSGSHTFSLMATAEIGALFSFRHARRSVIYKAKRK